MQRQNFAPSLFTLDVSDMAVQTYEKAGNKAKQEDVN